MRRRGNSTVFSPAAGNVCDGATIVASGGVGRFDVGADTPDDHRLVNVDSAQLGIDWTPAGWLLLHADGIARQEQSGLSRQTPRHRPGLRRGFQRSLAHSRGGVLAAHVAREHRSALDSKYTITYSALNSWIAQEVRPIGADLQWSPGFYVTVGATAFRGNDTMGTLLAARGWTFGNYLTTYDENMPLPYPETTKPIGADLDHKNGYSERIRLSLPGARDDPVRSYRQSRANHSQTQSKGRRRGRRTSM